LGKESNQLKNYLQLTRHTGNTTLFLAVEMSLISILRGIPLHIHAEGLRGTGKTTIMRSIKQLLPKITRIKGCLYNCDPDNPHCPQHAKLTADEIAEIGIEEVPIPFLEISHSAKIGTVAGTINLKKLTDPTQPEAALLPGILPQAHRGIIFIDEINRLADTSPEITDLLLDAMGTKPGRVQIEETGLPLVEVPVSASVWAASNPDEEPGPLAEIRRQLSDRFDLVIPMGRPSTPEEVVDILTTDDESAKSDDRGLSTEERSQLEQLKNNIEDIALQCDIKMPEYLTNFLANLYINYNIESLRALEAIRQAAILHCSLRKRNQLMISDIITVLPLALYHRVNPATLTDIMNTVNNNRMVDDKKNGSGLKIPRFFQQKQTKQQEFVESAPPEKARSLRDLPEGGFIKKETEH
jgi:magnesium chelatase subunit I